MPEPNCNEDYLVEIPRRRIERKANHCGKDKQSYVLKYALISNHPVLDFKDVYVTDKNFHVSKYSRKISGSLIH